MSSTLEFLFNGKDIAGKRDIARNGAREARKNTNSQIPQILHFWREYPTMLYDHTIYGATGLRSTTEKTGSYFQFSRRNYE